jgi:crotonobetainyl-CoA:carnitine CoA-transferase CaiB-like acyl-CoA transferase
MVKENMDSLKANPHSDRPAGAPLKHGARPGALAGLRVVELARILAGPWIGQTLADLGADVIKVESPDGDETRRWGPPFVTDTQGQPLDAAYFHCCNRGKRSVVADFRSKSDLDFVKQLIDRADVVLENFKTGTLEKFGLDYQSVRSRNPRIVYCSVTGFGQDGPYAQRAGYDATIQAMSGIMDLTGEEHGEPQKIGVALADILTGLYGVVGIQAALSSRDLTGEGQHVDMALFDVMVGVLANQALNYFVSGTAPRRTGSAHPNIVPYQTFPVSDGHIMIAVGSDAQFAKLCDVLGRPDLAEDPAYRDNKGRVVHREALVGALRGELARWKRDDILSRLEAFNVPAGPINTLEDVFRDPQVLARQMRIDLPSEGVRGGRLPGLRSPLRLSSSPLQLSRPAPRLGEHTSEVKRELGIPAEA